MSAGRLVTSRLSAPQKDEARRLYRTHPELSVDALAASYGVGRTVMLRVLDGITRRPGRREQKANLTTAQMIVMRDAGITLAQIGKQAGLSESGVLKRIRNATKGELTCETLQSAY